jgi:mannose-6-phosphate isomerase-like protein (cupin superfamily)
MTAVRRVVTGHSPDGKAIVASDTEVEAVAPLLTPGAEFHRLWGVDGPPSFPDDGSAPPVSTYFPPVGGFRVGFFSVPPDGASAPAEGTDIGAAFADFEAQLPGLAGFMEPGAPGMHTTPTVDFEVVVEGEVWLELDDGVEVHLRTGDTVVQNGTRHAWRNHGTTTARMVVVLVGAYHATAPPVPPPA